MKLYEKLYNICCLRSLLFYSSSFFFLWHYWNCLLINTVYVETDQCPSHLFIFNCYVRISLRNNLFCSRLFDWLIDFFNLKPCKKKGLNESGTRCRAPLTISLSILLEMDQSQYSFQSSILSRTLYPKPVPLINPGHCCTLCLRGNITVAWYLDFLTF